MSRLQETQNIDANEVIEALKKQVSDLNYAVLIKDIRLEKLEKLVVSFETEVEQLKEDNKSNK